MNPRSGLMAPVVDRPAMSKDEARAVLARHVNGGPATALEVQAAIFTLEKRRPGRPYKFQLPALSRPVREQINAALCFNLGLALRAHRREA